MVLSLRGQGAIGIPLASMLPMHLASPIFTSLLYIGSTCGRIHR